MSHCSRAVIAFGAIVFFCGTPRAVVAKDKRIEAAVRRLDKRLERFFRKGGFVGLSIGIVTPDGQLIERHFGASRKGGGKPNARTLYHIGSLTKLFTAMLALRLRDEKVWRLDDSARRYLGGVELDRRVRLVHLLTHTSGLPHLPPGLQALPGDPYNRYSETALRRDLSRLVLDAGPGERYRYSNFGFSVLGNLAARVTKRPFARLLREKILEPLGLVDTRFVLSAEQKGRTALGYRGGRVPKEVPDWRMGALAPSGALYSTLTDLARLVALQWSPPRRSPLRPATLREMQLARYRFDQVAPESRLRGGIGLAWHLLPLKIGDRELPIVWHNGVFTAFRSFVGLSLERRIGVVVLSNTAADVNKLGLGLLQLLAPLGRPRATVTAGSELRRVAKALAGEIRSTPTSALEALFHPIFRSHLRAGELAKLIAGYAKKLGPVSRRQLRVGGTPRDGELILEGTSGAKLTLRLRVDASRKGARIVLFQPLRFEEARK